MFIYENQRVNNANEHHQWNSSKMKINDDYQQRKSSMCGMKINMGNANRQ